ADGERTADARRIGSPARANGRRIGGSLERHATSAFAVARRDGKAVHRAEFATVRATGCAGERGARLWARSAGGAGAGRRKFGDTGGRAGRFAAGRATSAALAGGLAAKPGGAGRRRQLRAGSA